MTVTRTGLAPGASSARRVPGAVPGLWYRLPCILRPRRAMPSLLWLERLCQGRVTAVTLRMTSIILRVTGRAATLLEVTLRMTAFILRLTVVILKMTERAATAPEVML